MLETVLITLPICAVTLLTPGPDVTLVLSTAIMNRRKSAFEAALGIALGTSLWLIISVLVFSVAFQIPTTVLNLAKLTG